MNAEQRRTLEVAILASIIFKQSREALEKRLAEKGIALSMLQFGIMRCVSQEPYTISDLSKKMLLDPSTLVPAVDALERKGLIRRERDPNDRRRIPLVVTEDALRLLHDSHTITDDDPLKLALCEIGEADSEQLRDLLRNVVVRLPDGEAMLAEIEGRIRAHLQDTMTDVPEQNV